MKSWLPWVIAAAAVGGVMTGCGGDDDSTPAVTPVTPVVAVPTGLSVEPGDTVNTVQWSAVAGATSYTLYWSTVSPVTKTSATAIPNVGIRHEHTGLTNGKLYYYAVTARNSGGESDLSSMVGAMPMAAVPVPDAPEQLNATAGDTTVTLSWSKATGADTYSIYWSKATPVVVGAAGVTKIDKVAATSYQHTGLTNGDRYYYVVTAVNSSGVGKASSEASAAPQAPAPGRPRNLAATAGDGGVLLSWSPTLNATSYNVYWSKTAGVVPGGAGVTQIPNITATSQKRRAARGRLRTQDRGAAAGHRLVDRWRRRASPRLRPSHVLDAR